MFKKIANTIQAQVIALIIALAFIILSLVNIFSVTMDIKVVLSVFPLIVFSIRVEFYSCCDFCNIMLVSYLQYSIQDKRKS